MSERSRPRLIYWVHLLLLFPGLIAWVYLEADLALHPAIGPSLSAIDLVVGLMISPLTVAVGLLCIRRARGNIVGAILVLWGMGIASIVNPHLEKLPVFIQVLSYTYSGIFWPAIFYLFWYFPDGRVYPARWAKWVDWVVLLTYGAGILLGATTPLTPAGGAANPIYIPALAPIVGLINVLSASGAAFGFLGGIVSLSLRFRSAEPRTRQQMKWLVWSTVPALPLIAAQLASLLFHAVISDWLGNLLQLWLMLLPVVAVGNAILRHKLYDIDIIIRRTLVYSILTTILAIIYFGGVILVQQVLKPLTESSDLAIVISTLAIAALFTPVRRRVQSVIDRRFYRRKYDAQKTLEGFNATLREAVDLDTLEGALVGVVSETMQPTKVALWVRHAPPVFKETP